MTTRPLAPAQLAPAIRQKAILALCTLGLSLPARAQKSAFTTFDPPGPIVETIPTSMNPSGAITGWYFDGNIFHGFLRSRQGAFTILDFPGATCTSGASINPAGTITGYYFDASVPAGFHGFVRSPDGDWTSFDPVGATDTEPASINPAGEIAGTYYDANHVSHGFLRDRDGAITSFDV